MRDTRIYDALPADTISVGTHRAASPDKEKHGLRVKLKIYFMIVLEKRFNLKQKKYLFCLVVSKGLTLKGIFHLQPKVRSCVLVTHVTF